MTNQRRRLRRRTVVLLSAAASLLLMGCDADVRTPVQPSVSPSTTPSPTSSAVTLSGQVLEVDAGGARRPIGARQLHVEVEVSSLLDPQRGGWVPVGADGRYRLSNVPDGRFVKINSVDTGRPTEHRFCATNTVIRGDTTLDVLLFLPGATLPPLSLSGQVFRIVDGMRVPVAGAAVYFATRAYGADVEAWTDADGRYSLCGVPASGRLYLFCGNDILAFNQPVFVQANHVIDIDATTFHSCLLLATPQARTRFR